jgi:hypothetical protein
MNAKACQIIHTFIKKIIKRCCNNDFSERFLQLCSNQNHLLIFLLKFNRIQIKYFMKNTIFTFVLLIAASFTMNAQVKTPAPSPAAKIMQTVGMTEIEVAYSRPSMRDREIFGGLVPFGKMWRTGANASTKVTVSTDVVIEGNELKKGTYALYAIPGKEEWTIVFHKNLTHWGVGKYDEKEDAFRFKVKPTSLTDAVETFTIGMSNLALGTATMDMMWADTKVSFSIDTKVDALVEASIKKILSGPSMNDYYSAAAYNLMAKKDLEQAYDWINMAMEKGGNEKFWMVRRKALIEAELGKYKDAIKSAELSLELATKAGNEGYIRMNRESISEWANK